MQISRVRMKIAVHDTDSDTYYYAALSPYAIKKYDNGALISCGLKVPQDISRKAWQQLKKVQISQEEWQHSGCLSQCIRRGDTTCKW